MSFYYGLMFGMMTNYQAFINTMLLFNPYFDVDK